MLEWENNRECMGQYEPLIQQTKADLEKTYAEQKDAQWFFIEKKDGTKIGSISHFLSAGEVELGYFITSTERRKGFATEAITLMVDYLFLSREIIRIQAKADPENIASWKALEKAGFKREGVLRKTFYCRGKWRDDCMYSILKEEWRTPRTLAATSQNQNRMDSQT